MRFLGQSEILPNVIRSMTNEFTGRIGLLLFSETTLTHVLFANCKLWQIKRHVHWDSSLAVQVNKMLTTGLSCEILFNWVQY